VHLGIGGILESLLRSRWTMEGIAVKMGMRMGRRGICRAGFYACTFPACGRRGREYMYMYLSVAGMG